MDFEELRIREIEKITETVNRVLVFITESKDEADTEDQNLMDIITAMQFSKLACPLTAITSPVLTGWICGAYVAGRRRGYKEGIMKAMIGETE